jgi:hypothetical protein
MSAGALSQVSTVNMADNPVWKAMKPYLNGGGSSNAADCQVCRLLLAIAVPLLAEHIQASQLPLKAPHTPKQQVGCLHSEVHMPNASPATISLSITITWHYPAGQQQQTNCMLFLPS